jgi:hypothetical protein
MHRQPHSRVTRRATDRTRFVGVCPRANRVVMTAEVDIRVEMWLQWVAMHDRHQFLAAIIIIS